ncbi:hypothetical protein Pmar_PMAR018398 [Perkinsus marinus ATCC 50983]|uniref:Uncharacterized protein n=1 Tax=Perkinsus marinus (strain ATCC 50983 / TXsc) TaxID=423536 RepID=C5LJE3_PERM5|nr:hypothetical protein Pmar_PMAR018398 [Perkinsus marinus ATCC 50983]EER03143.1 hypothetical protein Pmar_PMAR018398 [Perkinsus marinus ATCC 50983]|eukprot:XP_002771327.1 hypothetical protein Pmar_PMAR018398 [Perkinsus marinus ATCC 50983]
MPSAYGSLLFATVMEAALGVLDAPLKITADYPPGCYGGPGPGEGSNITDMLAPSCIYSMESYTTDGSYTEVAGIILNTNRPGHYGSMSVNFTVSSPTRTREPDILVVTDGWAHLSVGDETRDFWWNPAPGKNSYGPDRVFVFFRVPTIDFGTLPRNVSVWSSWDSLIGGAQSDGLGLRVSHKCSSNVPYSEFYSSQQILIKRVRGGWYYLVKYEFFDFSPMLEDYTKYVIRGNLQNVNIL